MKLYNAHKLWPQRVIALKFDQLHSEVQRCSFHINGEPITEKLKPNFLAVKVCKSQSELCAKCFPFFSIIRAYKEVKVWSIMDWQHGRNLQYF